MELEELPVKEGDTPLTAYILWKTYKAPIILAVVSICSIIIGLVLLLQSVKTAEPVRFQNEEATSNAKLSQTITIDIEGALVNPGVYQLPADSRVEDAITIAGGLTSQADTARIAKTVNRATRLIDGAKLYFPKLGEIRTAPQSSYGIGSESNEGGLSSLININTASLSELDTLPGVGPVTAQKIIDNRPYQTIEELATKHSVTQSVFEKMKGKITL